MSFHGRREGRIFQAAGRYSWAHCLSTWTAPKFEENGNPFWFPTDPLIDIIKTGRAKERMFENCWRHYCSEGWGGTYEIDPEKMPHHGLVQFVMMRTVDYGDADWFLEMVRDAHQKLGAGELKHNQRRHLQLSELAQGPNQVPPAEVKPQPQHDPMKMPTENHVPPIAGPVGMVPPTPPQQVQQSPPVPPMHAPIVPEGPPLDQSMGALPPGAVPEFAPPPKAPVDWAEI